METDITTTKDGRPLRHVATLVIAEYDDDAEGNPLYVKVSYSPVTEEELVENVPQSFLAMSKIWQSVIAPLVTPAGSAVNAPSPTTHQ